jgi:4-amino-4-deoxy-L-arabinose transferase-like glycosyltransferase
VSATASTTVRERRTARALWNASWPLVGLGVLAVLVALAVHHWIYPAYSWNRDEPVYLWQTRALRAGQILPTDGGAPAFFQPWLSGHGPGYFFSQYTLGWPLVLLAGQVLFGTATSALAFGSLLAVLGTYAFARTVTGDRVVSLVAAAVMLASPIFAIQSGVYLGYLFTFGLGLLFGAALVTGIKRRRPILLVVGGALVGWIFMTRPFDAVLWAGAFGAYVVVDHWRQWSRLLRAAGWVTLGAIPLVIATLAYNKKVTGTLTEFPITAADPLDTFGFGLRRLMPTFGKDDYTLTVAIKSTGKNGFFLPLFLFGSYLGVAVAGVGLWLRRRDRSTLALLFLMAAFPLGYFFFWGMHVSAATTTLSGPIYFIPLFAPLAVLIATAIVAAWHRRRAVGVVATAVLVVVTVPFAVNRIRVNQRLSEAQAPWKHGTDSIRGRALVFVWRSGPYLLFLNPFSENGPDLDDRVLFAADEGAFNLDMIARYPDRVAYLEKTSVTPEKSSPNDHPETPVISLVKLHVLRGHTVTFHTQITNTTGDPVVVAEFRVGGHLERRTLATDSTKGSVYETDWVVPVASASPVGDITVRAGFGASAEAAATASLRQVFGSRVSDGRLEVLLPSRKSHTGVVLGKVKWIEVDRLPGLRVTATADEAGTG